MKRAWIVLSVFLITSCVTKTNIIDLSLRIDDVMGVSVLPPQEEGWEVLDKNKTQLVLGKNGPIFGSIYIVMITLFKLPEFQTEQEFIHYVSQAKKAQAPKERFRIIRNKEESISGGTNYIVKYHSIAEDKVATAKFGDKTMLLEIFGYTAQHPKNHSVGVELGYSYRYPVGAEDINFKEKANAFLNQIIITDL